MFVIVKFDFGKVDMAVDNEWGVGGCCILVEILCGLWVIGIEVEFDFCVVIVDW